MAYVSSDLVAGKLKIGKSSIICVKSEGEVVCEVEKSYNEEIIVLDVDEDELYTTKELKKIENNSMILYEKNIFKHQVQNKHVTLN